MLGSGSVGKARERIGGEGRRGRAGGGEGLRWEDKREDWERGVGQSRLSLETALGWLDRAVDEEFLRTEEGLRWEGKGEDWTCMRERGTDKGGAIHPERE